MPAPKMMTSPTTPTIASRWRRNLRRAYDHWLRTWSSRPAAAVASSRRSGAGMMPSMACSTGATVPEGPRWAGVGSVIPDARVEVPVQDVGDEVKDDDDDRGHHEIRHHRVEIRVLQAVDEVVAEAVEAEDRLRDDRTAEQAAEVERRHGHDRDERVPDDVAGDHPPLRQALRPRGPHVVAVDHVQHRGAHVPAVQREADD